MGRSPPTLELQQATCPSSFPKGRRAEGGIWVLGNEETTLSSQGDLSSHFQDRSFVNQVVAVPSTVLGWRHLSSLPFPIDLGQRQGWRV